MVGQSPGFRSQPQHIGHYITCYVTPRNMSSDRQAMCSCMSSAGQVGIDAFVDHLNLKQVSARNAFKHA